MWSDPLFQNTKTLFLYFKYFMYLDEETRTIHSYHRECLEIGTTAQFQSQEIKKRRAEFLDKVKLTQERRCLTSLQAGYCLRMSLSEVKTYTQLPFMKPDDLAVSERFQEAEDSSAVKEFLQTIYKTIHLLPEFLASIPSQIFHQPAPFLPAAVSPRDFMACSTLPALFGHCWTRELKLSYIDFMIKITEQLPPSQMETFREHWLFECFKNYIHAANINKFLAVSIGDVLYEIIRSRTEWSHNQLIGWVKEMVIRMQKSISIFPADVKILLRKFAHIGAEAPSEEVIIKRIEMLFIDCILAPAISSPKAYSVLPATFQLDMSPTGPVRRLLMLAQLFKCILHPKQAQLRYSNLNIDELEKIQLKSFLMNLIEVDETTEVVGPSIEQVMHLLGKPYAIMLFTWSDVCLLAKILAGKYPEAMFIPTDKPVNFEFFRYDLWNPEALGVGKMDISENEVEPAPPSTLASVASALFKFLAYAREDERAPENLTQFFEYHKREAELKYDLKTYTYINHLKLRLQELVPSEYADILGYLEDEIQRHKDFLERNTALLTGIASVENVLNREIQLYRAKAQQSYPTVYSCILNSWFEHDPSVKISAQNKAEDMLRDKQAFLDFFMSTVESLRTYTASFASYASTGVVYHYHTWLCQMMTLEDFMEEHKEYIERDERLVAVKDDAVTRICIDPAPAKLRKLFENQSLFQFCGLEINNADSLAIPLECAERIATAVNIIQKMFDLACGGMPQADEMTPLLTFALVKSGIPRMYSLMMYLSHFLCDVLIDQTTKLLPESLSVAVVHFVNHVSSLDDILTILASQKSETERIPM